MQPATGVLGGAKDCLQAWTAALLVVGPGHCQHAALKQGRVEEGTLESEGCARQPGGPQARTRAAAHVCRGLGTVRGDQAPGNGAIRGPALLVGFEEACTEQHTGAVRIAAEGGE